MISEQTLKDMVINYVEQSSGWFHTEDVNKALLINSAQDKDNVRQILHRLYIKELLEKDYRINGKWRKVQDELVEMDLQNAGETVPMDVQFPFQLERVFQPLPHSLWVVAGAPNAGKTTVALEFCLLNQFKQHIVYFSSEMGATRLMGRLKKFPLYQRDGIAFQAFERSDNYQDAVKKFPDSIIVIDYLEIYENFYEIGQKLKLIFDALKGNSSALVLVQKNPSRKNFKGQIEYVDLGRGGNLGLEKASLYVAMDSAGQNGNSRLKIVKAKEWQIENLNPNNMEFQYKLINGAEFVGIQYPPGFPQKIEHQDEMEF